MKYKHNDPFYMHLDEYYGAMQNYNKFIYDSSLISDFEVFCNRIDEKSGDDKEQLEKAVISLFKLIENGDITGYYVAFMEKYKKYLNYKLENEPKEFYNNKLCWYVLTTNYEGKSQEFSFIENKSSESKDKIEKELDKIIDKINKKENLSKSEKQYFENYLLINASKSSINSDLVFEFFNIFPIENTDTFRNKQLLILFMISKKLYELNVSSFVSLHEEINYDDRTAGEVRYYSDGTPKIDIYEIDERVLKTEENLFHILYVLYHEIGHINQKINHDSFSTELQEIFKVEKYIQKNNYNYYHENHDSFMIERQANIYAITELMNEFSDNKTIMEICKKELDKLEKLNTSNPNFLNAVFAEYDRLCQDSLGEDLNPKASIK